MTGYRWDNATAALVLEEARPGLVDLWAAVPPGHTMDGGTAATLRRVNQSKVLQGLAVVQKQAIVATGHGVGLRPEIFSTLAALPGADVLADTVVAIFESGKLDMSDVSNLGRQVATMIFARVGEAMGAQVAMADFLGGAGQVIAFVYQYVSLIATSIREQRELELLNQRAIKECVPPANSAETDDADVHEALKDVMSGSDWSRLFLPRVSPVDFEYVSWESQGGAPLPGGNDTGFRGFTCCPSAFDRGRVIAPIGMLIGNRSQNWVRPAFYNASGGPGFGLLPMCPDLPVHRALIVPGGNSAGQYDLGDSLPVLAGLGVQAWRLLWGRGPAAFAVDGSAIADSWLHYLETMAGQIGRNEPGWGSGSKPANALDWGPPLPADAGICDSWGVNLRNAALDRFFARLGVAKRDWATSGIVHGSLLSSLPVAQWQAFAAYQSTLLERLTIAYVDARACAPAWRERVATAQRDLLEHPNAVCRVVMDAIPDPEYRAAVSARKHTKGAQCFTASTIDSGQASPTQGPSLAPLGDDSPAIPDFPSAPKPKPERGPTRTRSSGSAGLLVGTGALGLGLLALTRK